MNGLLTYLYVVCIITRPNIVFHIVRLSHSLCITSCESYPATIPAVWFTRRRLLPLCCCVVYFLQILLVAAYRVPSISFGDRIIARSRFLSGYIPKLSPSCISAGAKLGQLASPSIIRTDTFFGVSNLLVRRSASQDYLYNNSKKMSTSSLAR